MTPDEKVRKSVARLNQRLLEGLGYPAYAWYFSESLFIREMRRQTDSGIHLLSPQTIERKLLPDLDHQWVLCREVSSEVMANLGENHKDNQWILRDAQGSGLTPCGSQGGYVATRRYHNPTLEDTLNIIDMIRKFREKSGAEHMEDMLARSDARDVAHANLVAQAAVEVLRPSGWAGAGSDHPFESMSGRILKEPTLEEVVAGGPTNAA